MKETKTSRICVYCGKELKERKTVLGFFSTKEYVCDCIDVKKNEEITEQIEAMRRELESQRPKPKFKITSKLFIEEIQ